MNSIVLIVVAALAAARDEDDENDGVHRRIGGEFGGMAAFGRWHSMSHGAGDRTGRVYVNAIFSVQ